MIEKLIKSPIVVFKKEIIRNTFTVNRLLNILMSGNVKSNSELIESLNFEKGTIREDLYYLINRPCITNYKSECQNNE